MDRKMDTITMNNPFFAKSLAPPSHFIGRHREIELILDRLANPLNRGGSAIVGASGIGKTSLLHYLQSAQVLNDWPQLSSDMARFVFMPSYFIVPFTELNFWLYLFQDLQDWLRGTYREKVDLLINELEAGRLPSIHALIKFFTELGQERDSFVVVLLDNFDTLFQAMRASNWQDNISFLHKLRGLMNLPAPRGFSLIITSESHLFDLFSEVQWFGSQFCSNMSVLNFGPFTIKEATELICSYLGPTRVTFTPEEINQLYESSRGHPGQLQELASDLFNNKKEALPKPLQVEEDTYKLSIEDLEPELANLLARAIDKLFYEAGAVQLSEDPHAGVKRGTTRDQMRSWKLSVPTEDQQEELKYRVEILDIHRRNIRTLEKQRAAHGGVNIPLDLTNQLEEAEKEIGKHLSELIRVLQKIYGRSIEAIKQGDKHPISC
jgi:hypothetical protein